MHVLLTGASGRIGSYILRLLLDKGYSVFAVDVTPLPDEILFQIPHSQRSTLHHRALDLSDIDAVENLFKSDIFDGVIHFGSIPSPDKDDPRVVHNNNVTGTYNVLRTAAHKGRVRRMCQASSVNAIGMSFTKEEHWGLAYVPIDEKEPVRPEDPYSLSKVIIEAQASALCREIPDLRIASLRLSLCVDSYDDAWPTSNAKNLWSYSSKDAVARAALLSLTSEGWDGAEVFNIFAPQITWEGGLREEQQRKEGDPPDQSVGALDLLQHHRPGKVGTVDRSWWKDDPRRGFYDCRNAERMLGWKHDL